ncbi:MAG: hypothetical protein ACXVPL_11920 [Actinomycetota bacterium]
MTQLRSAGLLALLVVAFSVTVASACPAPSSEALTFRQMIKQHTTGYADQPVMFLGKVVVVKDLGGGPYGKAIAKLAVAAHPVRFAPLVSRVRFYRPKPSDPAAFGYERFDPGHFYVVIASRRNDGSFRIVEICGPTSEVGKRRFWSLVRLARHR